MTLESHLTISYIVLNSQNYLWDLRMTFTNCTYNSTDWREYPYLIIRLAIWIGDVVPCHLVSFAWKLLSGLRYSGNPMVHQHHSESSHSLNKTPILQIRYTVNRLDEYCDVWYALPAYSSDCANNTIKSRNN